MNAPYIENRGLHPRLFYMVVPPHVTSILKVGQS